MYVYGHIAAAGDFVVTQKLDSCIIVLYYLEGCKFSNASQNVHKIRILILL